MSTRPAPRPRPRPRPRAVTDNVPLSSSPPSDPVTGSTPNPLKPVSINVAEDEDAMFLKNRNRTAQTWKKLNQLAEGPVAKKPKSPQGSDSAEAEETTPRKKHKRREQSETLPDWTKSEAAIVLSSSDDEEDELLRRVEKSTPTARRNVRSEANKRISKRPRSRSITPPPELSSAAVQHTRDTIRRMIGATSRRAPSPSFGADDDSSDDIELDPELAVIGRTAELEARRQMSTPAVGSRNPSPVHAVGPEEVMIKVRWQSHPLNPNPQRITYEYNMRRHDPFKALFDETADSASIPVDKLIITYDGKRVFPFASPHGIGVWDEALFEGYEKTTYDYVLAHRHATPEPSGHISLLRAATPSVNSVAASEAGSDQDEDDDTMKLTFRSAVSKDITLTVRPTTKCSVILKAFLTRAGLSDKYPSSPVKGKKGKGKNSMPLCPALMVDGERLDADAEISSADLEDGDLVEVTGL
ncbi:hypothetical protein PHLGIDRAFT_126128 [Phlebiopsis gigantea 11061_1 CR5-6]|uniref:Rad60/SUMO-like domain-containing protein n=1 Tax=Phlebiopsis gigantea (strain 11061_1 CR5-6) TaxID=745531 RepID=A0A0C3S2T0_PHLG1|nr:hypothetical protein PHLGIDRAFT_126128 [Phlebiopsis gigantea 11061_1 CR5-6]